MSLSALPSAYPLIQAPMAGAQDSQMAIAVCRAGGLGSLAAALLSPPQLAAELAAIQAATDAPFNVNFFAHQMLEPTPQQMRRWHDFLQPYFDRFGVDAAAMDAGGLRQPFGDAQLAIVQQYRPAVVSFHFGLPAAAQVQALKDIGTCIIASATSVAEAQWLAERGVDAVIAQGSEAGGHRATFLAADVASQTGTLALLPQIVDAVPLPVIAAGGIADVRGIRAALQLGATAVQIGTAYLLCDESRISPLHRGAINAAMQAPQQAQTAITNLFSGKPARGLVNTLMRDGGYMHADAAPFPYAAAAVNAIRAKAEKQGNSGFTPLWCGQNPSGCRAVSATELTQDLCRAFQAA